MQLWKRIASFCLTVLIIAGQVMAQNPGLPASVEQAIVAGDWAGVRELLEPVVSQDDHNEPALYWLGVALVETGNTEQAVPHLTRALELNPESSPTAWYLTRCAAEIGDTATAHKLADRFPLDAAIALEAGKISLDQYFRLKSRGAAKVSERLQRLAEANDRLERAVVLDDTSAQARYLFALTLKEYRRWGEALEQLEYAIALEPVGWEVYALAGECYHELGLYEESAAAYGVAAPQAPAEQKAELWFRHGEALRMSGAFSDAARAYEQALVSDRDRYDVRFRLGESALIAGNLPLAVWAFNEARTVDGNLDALVGAGQVQIELGHPKEAERLIRQALDEAEAKNLRVPSKWYHWLGRAQWESGKQQDAADNLFRGIGWEGDFSLTRASWAFRAAMETDNPYGAIRVCEWVAGQGYPDIALDGIKTVMQTWPMPRLKDLQQGRRRPHTEVAIETMGRIAYRAKRFRTSAMIYSRTNRHRGRLALADAGWAFLAIDNPAAAEATFRDVFMNTQEADRDWSLIGGACALITQGISERARKALQSIEHEQLIHARDTCRLWALTNAGDPAARELADPFTLLGVVGWEIEDLDDEYALTIRTVLPGSALAEQDQFEIRPMDRLVSVNGTHIFDLSDIQKIRDQPVPNQPIEIEIMRGPYPITIELDLSKTIHALPTSAHDDQPTGEGNP